MSYKITERPGQAPTIELIGPDTFAELRKAAMTDEQIPPAEPGPDDTSDPTVQNPGDGGVTASATGATEEAKPNEPWDIKQAWNTLIERLGFHDLAAPPEDDTDTAQPA